MSNSSNSPPLPCTPPPRQTRNTSRYPDNLGRVPLHRRGTSQTYERLEDLLREAGYKETRIFTPEGEHDDVTYHEQDSESPLARRSASRKGVGAVVEFFTGLLPSSTMSSVRSVATTKPETPCDEQTTMVSPTFSTQSAGSGTLVLSPQMQQQVYGSGRSTPRTIMSSTDDIQALRRSNSPVTSTPVPPSPTIRPHSPYYARHPQHQAVQRMSSQSGSFQNQQRGHVPLSRQSSLRVVNGLPQQQNMHLQQIQQPAPIAHPRPSRATAYLRHMASRQDVPERPSSTPALIPPYISVILIEAMMKARKTSCREGSAAYMGGPSQQRAATASKHDPHVAAKGRTHVLRHTRSSISQVSSYSHAKKTRPSRPHALRSTLSDQTNKSQSKLSVNSGASVEMLAPPVLFLQIERGRSTCSESKVYPTRVYCRSAPGSRGASVVRDGGGKEKGSGFLKGQAGRARSGRKAQKDRVPSLAKTKAEGDMWTRPKKRKTSGGGMDDATHRVLGGPRYSPHRHHASIRLGESGYGSDAVAGHHGYGYNRYRQDGARFLSSNEDEDVSDEYDEDEYDDDDDDDEGELDLARMLVPAKRQHSIISLRKHLAVTTAAAGSGSSRAYRGTHASSRAAASASRLGEGIGVGEFESEIEGGGGASAALSRVVGAGGVASASTTMPAMRIRGAYASSTPNLAAARHRIQQ
ncbi:hypothetical protein M378DRAFT_26327 [Amanita muscaria Koide BX008]|uniref:Uncharacterized protein n=1 Tax=Amanita muscaria (strain Koide BX008) TaxID=946122 RepID=A0A0C2WVU0_AMAMK|nr:hypothetical protein M378DRAFT_26327 [Amanita muscaria Koide BX008]